jgi:hypothetical protein
MSAGKFRISAISCWSVGQGSHALKKAQRHGNARRTPPLFFRSSGWRAAYQDRGLGLGAWGLGGNREAIGIHVSGIWD